MFETTVYFILWYVILFIIYYTIRFSLKRVNLIETKKKTKWQNIAIFIFIVLLPAIPYAVVETQTALFGRNVLPSMMQIVNEYSLPGEKISSYKLMKYFGLTAEVYYVTPCTSANLHGQASFTVNIKRKDGKWVKANEPEVVWSDCGSADEDTFPPYR